MRPSTVPRVSNSTRPSRTSASAQTNRAVLSRSPFARRAVVDQRELLRIRQFHAAEPRRFHAWRAVERVDRQPRVLRHRQLACRRRRSTAPLPARSPRTSRPVSSGAVTSGQWASVTSRPACRPGADGSLALCWIRRRDEEFHSRRSRSQSQSSLAAISVGGLSRRSSRRGLCRQFSVAGQYLHRRPSSGD